MNVVETVIVVNEDGCCLVMLSGEVAFKLGEKASLGRFHLVDQNTLSRVSGFMDLSVCFGRSLPGHFGHLAK